MLSGKYGKYCEAHVVFPGNCIVVFYEIFIKFDLLLTHLKLLTGNFK